MKADRTSDELTLTILRRWAGGESDAAIAADLGLTRSAVASRIKAVKVADIAHDPAAASTYRRGAHAA